MKFRTDVIIAGLAVAGFWGLVILGSTVPTPTEPVASVPESVEQEPEPEIVAVAATVTPEPAVDEPEDTALDYAIERDQLARFHKIQLEKAVADVEILNKETVESFSSVTFSLGSGITQTLMIDHQAGTLDILQESFGTVILLAEQVEYR